MLNLIGDETLPDAASSNAGPSAASAAAPARAATAGPPAALAMPEVDLLGGFLTDEEAVSPEAAIPAEDLIGATSVLSARSHHPI